MLGLGIALRAVPRRFLMGTSLATLCLSALGALGYAITIVAGLVGATEQDPLGFPVKVTFSPGAGILLALAGCVAAGQRRGHQVHSALQVLIVRRHQGRAPVPARMTARPLAT